MNEPPTYPFTLRVYKYQVCAAILLLYRCIDSPSAVLLPSLGAACTGEVVPLSACVIASVRLWSLGKNGVETNDVLGWPTGAEAVSGRTSAEVQEQDRCATANASTKPTNEGDILDIDTT